MASLLRRIRRRVSRRGTGCLEGPDDSRDVDIDALGLASSSLPSQATLAAHEPPIKDQRSTSTCVAQALATAICIRESQAGLPLDPPSELFIYWHSRRLHGAQMIDGGTYVRTACAGLKHVGACSQSEWAWSRRREILHKRPTWSPSMQAHPRKGGRYYRIKDTGQARLVAIRAAVAAGHPVVFGTTIADSFRDFDGPWWIDRPNLAVEKPVGGHAMCITGYNASGFRVVNSWGRRWRAAGTCRLTDDYMAWYQTRDIWVIDGWNRIAGVR